MIRFAEVQGLAQDGGWPQAGCVRACCAGARERGLGARVACLSVHDGDQRWLLDCTPDFPAQLHAAGGPPLAGILLTHAHVGHYTGLFHLGPEVWGTRAMPVWAMPAMRAFLQANEPWATVFREGHATLRELSADVGVRLGAIEAIPRLVPHRGPWSETVGFELRGPGGAVFYLPDVDRWDGWDPEAILARVDRAYVDGTFFDATEIGWRDRSLVPHPLVIETLARFPGPERSRLAFLHLNHTNPLLDPDSAASAAVRAAGLSVAREGERHPL